MRGALIKYIKSGHQEKWSPLLSWVIDQLQLTVPANIYRRWFKCIDILLKLVFCKIIHKLEQECDIKYILLLIEDRAVYFVDFSNN